MEEPLLIRGVGKGQEVFRKRRFGGFILKEGVNMIAYPNSKYSLVLANINCRAVTASQEVKTSF